MIRTKHLVSELNEVPREWIFEHYLELPEKLTGQPLMILSPFNPKDRKPSLSIYISNTGNKSYMFRDFSTGYNGGPVDLVLHLFNLTSKGEAAFKIIEDYNHWILNHESDYALREFKIRTKYKVSSFKTRSWTKSDEKFWTSFHIGSRLLDKYNVKPLESYKMNKEDDNELKEIEIKGSYYIYGFFREDGTLYKIYQPMTKDNKFVKIRDYIQGTDQLTYKTKYLVICSSLKDMMCFMRLGYKDIECVAPDSENVLISKHVVNSYLMKYERVCTLFDIDDPGLAGMKKYLDTYQIKGVKLELSKDLSDSVRDYGLDKVRQELTPLLKQALS